MPDDSPSAQPQGRGGPIGHGCGHRRHAIGHGVARDVLLQAGIRRRIGLEREHASRRTDPLRKQHRVRADVGARLEHDAAGSNRRAEGGVLLRIPRDVAELGSHEHDFATRQHRPQAPSPAASQRAKSGLSRRRTAPNAPPDGSDAASRSEQDLVRKLSPGALMRRNLVTAARDDARLSTACVSRAKRASPATSGRAVNPRSASVSRASSSVTPNAGQHCGCISTTSDSREAARIVSRAPRSAWISAPCTSMRMTDGTIFSSRHTSSIVTTSTCLRHRRRVGVDGRDQAVHVGHGAGVVLVQRRARRPIRYRRLDERDPIGSKAVVRQVPARQRGARGRRLERDTRPPGPLQRAASTA